MFSCDSKYHLHDHREMAALDSHVQGHAGAHTYTRTALHWVRLGASKAGRTKRQRPPLSWALHRQLWPRWPDRLFKKAKPGVLMLLPYRVWVQEQGRLPGDPDGRSPATVAMTTEMEIPPKGVLLNGWRGLYALRDTEQGGACTHRHLYTHTDIHRHLSIYTHTLTCTHTETHPYTHHLTLKVCVYTDYIRFIPVRGHSLNCKTEKSKWVSIRLRQELFYIHLKRSVHCTFKAKWKSVSTLYVLLSVIINV